MKFHPTPIHGAYHIEPVPIHDERGYFTRTWCSRQWAALGLETQLAQCNISHSRELGTLRGMHYQARPCVETKLVRCMRGAIFDVIVDLRPDSPSFLAWYGVELSAENGAMLYVPKGVAHGLQTLQDHSEVFYQMTEFYAPGYGRGVRWDDPLFAIRWPLPVSMISEQDRNWRLSQPEHFSGLSGLLTEQQAVYPVNRMSTPLAEIPARMELSR